MAQCYLGYGSPSWSGPLATHSLALFSQLETSLPVCEQLISEPRDQLRQPQPIFTWACSCWAGGSLSCYYPDCWLTRPASYPLLLLKPACMPIRAPARPFTWCQFTIYPCSENMCSESQPIFLFFWGKSILCKVFSAIIVQTDKRAASVIL